MSPGENGVSGGARLVGRVASADERESDRAVAVHVRGTHLIGGGGRLALRAAREHYVLCEYWSSCSVRVRLSTAAAVTLWAQVEEKIRILYCTCTVYSATCNYSILFSSETI